MADMYHLFNGGAQSGPYVLDQLATMWQSGAITAVAQYWKEGDGPVGSDPFDRQPIEPATRGPGRTAEQALKRNKPNKKNQEPDEVFAPIQPDLSSITLQTGSRSGSSSASALNFFSIRKQTERWRLASLMLPSWAS